MLESEAPAPKSGTVSARRRETRTRLLDAAFEVFAEHGIQGASVERICSRANFTRGAFYSNFSSKEELFIAVLTREYEQYAEKIHARALELTERITHSNTEFTRADAARFVNDLLDIENTKTAWFALETEFLLLVLREPNGPIKYVEFDSVFRDKLRLVAEGIIHAAGRRFTIPTDEAINVLGSVHDRASRESALNGKSAPYGICNIGERMANLIFAITERA